MELLKTPYTIEQIKENRDEDGWIKGVVAVELSDIVDLDLEGLLDLLEELLIDGAILSQTEYKIVGHLEDTLYLEVQGIPMSDELEEVE